MTAILRWFATNRVAANIFVLVVAGGGILSLFSIRTELLPEINPRLITVRVPYPGASPEEAEQAINVRIEEAIQDVQGIRKIVSHASEGIGLVLVHVQHDASVADVLDKVKSRVDGIETFPAEAEEPETRDVPLEFQTVSLTVSGKADEATLKRLAERVRDDLQSIPGITLVRIVNARPWEISIEVSEETLRRHGLTFDEVARAVRQGSLDLPGGELKTGAGEIRLRTKEQAYKGEDFERIPILTQPDGAIVRLGDLARIRDGFVEEELYSTFDGEPALVLQVFRVGEQSALQVARSVKEYVDGAQGRLPEGIKVTIWEDWSVLLKDRLDLLIRNAGWGLLLVFAALALFLRPAVAIWVTVGIPVSFLGAFWLMPGLDQSINLLTLFGFILVLGIVVDDAIVVSENIYRIRMEGVPPLEAAWKGARQVLLPVFLAVLTNILAFIPMLGLPGANGDFSRAIAIVVILCFTFSIIESFVALPAHLSHLSVAPPRRGLLGALPRLQDAIARGFDRFVQKVYRPLLSVAVRHRWVTLAGSVAGLLVVGGAMAGGRINFEFFPPIDADNIIASVEMPVGTPAETTAAAVDRLEKTARQVTADLRRELGRPIGRHVLATVGAQPGKRQQDDRSFGANTAAFMGSHLGEVNLELVPSEGRAFAAAEIARRWREALGPIPGARSLTFFYSTHASGPPIALQLRSNDLDLLPVAARKLRERLAQFDGVYDISDTYRAGQTEIRTALKPSGTALGLSTADLARQVRQGFFGEEVQRIQRGRDDVRVMLRYPKRERESIGYLERMRVRGPGGLAPAVQEVATLEWATAPVTIQRQDRRRTVTVTADVDTAVANADKIVGALAGGFLPELTREHPQLTWAFEGQQEDQREMMTALLRGMALVLLMIYAALAVLFMSYVQPALVMLAIPFGVAGAIVAHWGLGMPLTLLSFIGIMALLGVVVNDSLVMIDFVNVSRAEGRDPKEAILHAGPLRFRPILLTSLTTFAGLTPMLFERSLQAQFLIPMAVSLAYGVAFATVVTLFIIPAAYLALEDVRSLAHRLFGRRPEPGPPAPSTPADG